MAQSFFERLTGSRSASSTPPEPPKERTTPKSLGKEDESSLTDDDAELTVDLFDDGDHIIVQAIVGGVKPEDIDVQVTDEAVTIRGKRHRVHEMKGNNFYFQELYWGSFSRHIALPQEVISDEAEASTKNGLLTIKLPKRDRNKTQKLRIKSD